MNTMRYLQSRHDACVDCGYVLAESVDQSAGWSAVKPSHGGVQDSICHLVVQLSSSPQARCESGQK